MLLIKIVHTSQKLAATRSRLEKIDILASCLNKLKGPDVETGVNFLIGRIPQGRIGIGPSILRDIYPGPGAKEPVLTLQRVDRVFETLAALKGSGSMDKKRSILVSLFREATKEEQDFLVRLILGELRQGALEGIMIDALGKASGIPSDRIRRAVMVAGDIASVAKSVLEEGLKGLDRFSLKIFVPVKPMLAEAGDDLTRAIEQLGRAAFEYKLDGVRIQVHKMEKEVRIFTRRMNDITSEVPEIVEAVKDFPVRSVILDGETLALNRNGFPFPFQVTMRRFGRRLNIREMRERLPLTPFFFDCLHLDGEDLIDKPAEERFSLLGEVSPARLVIPRIITESPEEADEFLDKAIKAGHEGLMAKSLASIYEAGNRGKNWLKIKPAHTLDMVILAAEWGHGRRAGFLSNLHLGVRDPATGGFVMVGKTFKGLTDEMLAWQTRKLLELEIARDAYTVYVRPMIVVEIAFNEVQKSPHYPGGVALRFARVKRYRPDKKVEEIDTIDTLKKLIKKQGNSRGRTTLTP